MVNQSAPYVSTPRRGNRVGTYIGASASDLDTIGTPYTESLRNDDAPVVGGGTPEGFLFCALALVPVFGVYFFAMLSSFAFCLIASVCLLSFCRLASVLC